MTPPPPSVTVSAWIGSANAGDELVHAGLRTILDGLGVTDVHALSIAGAATAARHGGSAGGRMMATAGYVAGRRRSPLVLGGGGILQDETSVANLPYHLAPVLAARRRGVPVAGVGLGAGPVSSATGRALIRGVLGGLELVVRDRPSAAVLQVAGLQLPVVACDLALHLPDPAPIVDHVVAVSLRPWSASRHRLPVSLRRTSTARQDASAARLASAVDAVAGVLGLPVRFVAFDRDKDPALHRAVADRLSSEVVEALEPDPAGALAAVARATAVIAMRYHAGVAALLGRRPAVLLGYGSKVEALAADVGPGVVAVPWDVSSPGIVAAAARRAVDGATAGVLDGAVRRLRDRGAGNIAALERLFTRTADG